MSVGAVSDKQFIKDLKQSDDDVWLVARWLCQLFKRHVMVAPLKIRPDVSQRHQFRDNGDLFLVEDNGNLARIEVKWRSIDFTCREDFPFPSLMVGPVDHIDHMFPIAYAHIMLNATRTVACVIRGKTEKHWTNDRIYDSRYGRHSTVYQCPIEHCEFYDLSKV